MNTKCFYLNNDGSRWIVLDESKRREQRTWITKSGHTVTRRVIYYESFGNFATACISYKGIKVHVFLDTLLDD